jgi:diguanylate cyclase (GGDEF)-like protein
MQGPELLRELKRMVDELAALNEIGKALTSSLDISEVMQLILEKVSRLLRPSNWSLLMIDQRTGELYFHAARGPGADALLGLRLKPGEGIAGHVAQSALPLRVDDVRQDPRFASRFDEKSSFHSRSILCVPLMAKGRVLGLIELVNGAQDGPFSEEDLRTLSTVAEFASIALENAQNFAKVQELTVIDDHTGLYNSRHLKRQLVSEVVRAVRFGHPVSVIFFDLDRFKQVNDQRGHQSGSRVLLEVGQLLLRVLRSTDVAVRYGGDEFVVLLPETSRDQALEVATRLRDEVAAEPFLAHEQLGPLRLTASFGVATFPDDGAAPEELLRRADEAMYRVKARSRDGVEAASTAPREAPEARRGNESLTPVVSSEP